MSDFGLDTEPDTGVAFDFMAGLKLEVGKLSSAVSKLATELEARKALIPMHYDAVGSAVASGGIAVIDLSSSGLPSAGRVWEVKRWMVGGPGVAAVAGQAWLLATAQQVANITSAANTPLGDVCGASPTGAGLPWGDTFGARQAMVNDGERLMVVVTGATNAATYLAAASVDDYPIRAELAGNTVAI